MNSNYNPTLGIITTEMQPHEARLLLAASRIYFEIISDRNGTSHECEDCTGIVEDLSDVILQSTKDKHLDPSFAEAFSNMVRHKKPILEVPAMPTPPRDRIEREKPFWLQLRYFFNPPFTTEDFEKANCRYLDNHGIDTICYDGYGMPFYAEGIVTPEYNVEAWEKGTWDRWGKFRNRAGERRREFDLIKPNAKEEYAAKITGEAMILALIVILITSAI